MPMRRLSSAVIAVARVPLVTSATVVFVPVFLLARLMGARAAARVLRYYLGTCGGGFVKLGQLLATRYDLLPAAYCAELAQLLDSARTINAAVIVREIERELGRPIGELFATFDQHPLAAASIAQVHVATLPGGEDVVVKVRRPHARVVFTVDFALLALGSRLLDLLVELGEPRFRNMVQEVREAVIEELDFRREGRNCYRMWQLMQTDHVAHCAPRVFFDLSTMRVLTMARLRGIAVKDIIAAVDANDRDQLEVWKAHGIIPERVGRRLLVSVLTQSLRHRFFHCDPHPANLIVLVDGTLAWVDFGMTGWMDDRTWIQQFRMRDAIARRDVHRAYEALLESLEPIRDVNLTRFQQDVTEAMQDWIVASDTPGTTLVEKSSGYFLIRAFAAIRRAGLHMPTRLMRLYRTIMIADMVMLKLHPAIDWVAIMRRFVDVETQRHARELSESPLLPTVADTVQAFLRIPTATIALVDWLNTKLPRYGRLYERQFSIGEAVMIAAIRFFRGLTLLTLVALGLIAMFPDAFDAGALMSRLNIPRLPAAVGALGAFIWMTLTLRLIRR